MRLYHGSDHIIKEPKYGYGNTKNDYGKGFYCTRDLELAKEWAVLRDRNGFANIYEIDTTSLSMMDLSSDSYNVLNWLTILLLNREFNINTPIGQRARTYLLDHFAVDYEKYDIIKGYRADDSYFTYAKMFLNNTISIEQLSRAMRLGNLGEQIVLKSERAFRHINFIDAEFADCHEYGIKRKARDEKARNDFAKMKEEEAIDFYVMDIIREKWENSDVRLQ